MRLTSRLLVIYPEGGAGDVEKVSTGYMACIDTLIDTRGEIQRHSRSSILHRQVCL